MMEKRFSRCCSVFLVAWRRVSICLRSVDQKREPRCIPFQRRNQLPTV